MNITFEPKEIRMLIESQDENVKQIINSKIKPEPENVIETLVTSIVTLVDSGKTVDVAADLVLDQFKMYVKTEVDKIISIKTMGTVNINNHSYTDKESLDDIFNSSCKMFNVKSDKILDLYDGVPVSEYAVKNNNIILINEPFLFINRETNIQITNSDIDTVDSTNIVYHILKTKMFNTIEEVDEYLLNRTTITYLQRICLWRIGKNQNSYIVRVLTSEEMKEVK